MALMVAPRLSTARFPGIYGLERVGGAVAYISPGDQYSFLLGGLLESPRQAPRFRWRLLGAWEYRPLVRNVSGSKIDVVERDVRKARGCPVQLQLGKVVPGLDSNGVH